MKKYLAEEQILRAKTPEELLGACERLKKIYDGFLSALQRGEMYVGEVQMAHDICVRVLGKDGPRIRELGGEALRLWAERALKTLPKKDAIRRLSWINIVMLGGNGA